MALLIFLSYYILLALWGIRAAHQKFILAGLLTGSQIILTEIILGITACLYLPCLAALNAGLTAAVFFYVYVFDVNKDISFKKEGRLLLAGFKDVCSPSNGVLMTLACFVFLWMMLVAFFLPPRTSDDIVYHLPTIYEYIINHKIFLLPAAMDSHFAFPENAELLFLWPALFSHSQQFIDSVQAIVAFWAVFVIYGLCRAAGTSAKTSLFVALLFVFTPVVLAQMGSNYIDIITSSFFLCALYCAVMFYKTSGLIYFYSMALAAGLMWGMKYDAPILLLALIPFVLKKGWSAALKHRIAAGVLFLLSGGFWYLRNYLVLGTPVYPVDMTVHNFGLFKADLGNGPGSLLINDILKKLLFLWKDPGLGSLHGGYGIVFWAIALPSWIYVFVRSIIKKDFLNFWMSLPLILGVAKLMLVPLRCFSLTGRYSLFMTALGLVALGEVLICFEREIFFTRVVKYSCLAFSFLAVIQLSAVHYPDYNICRPLNDFLKNKHLSQERYISSFPRSLIKAWAVLDYLTLDDPRGLSCYFAMYKVRACSPEDKTWISPLYGTHLQNRVWNLQKDQTVPPDAFLYLGPSKQLHYFGNSIKSAEVMSNPDYVLVMRTKPPVVLLFIRKEFLKDEHKQQRLKEALGGDN